MGIYNTQHHKHIRHPLRLIEAGKIVAERRAEEIRIHRLAEQAKLPPTEEKPNE